MAHIIVSDGGWGKDVTLLGNEKDQFDLENIAGMLRNFAQHIDPQ